MQQQIYQMNGQQQTEPNQQLGWNDGCPLLAFAAGARPFQDHAGTGKDRHHRKPIKVTVCRRKIGDADTNDGKQYQQKIKL